MARDKSLKVRLGADTSEFDSKMKKANQSAEDFGKKGVGMTERVAKGFEKIAAAAAAAFALKKMVDFGVKMLEMSGVVDGTRRGFEKLNNPMLLQNLRESTRGAVDDLKLMQLAVRANNFKIPLDQLATYFKFATDRAIETGESVDYLVDSIIAGIGRKSVLVMDNLGISAVELQDEIQKVGDFGQAAGNIIKRSMGEMGEVADTAAVKVAALSSAWKNFTRGVSSRFQESEAGGGLLISLEWLTAQLNKGSSMKNPYLKAMNVDELNKELTKTKQNIEALEMTIVSLGSHPVGRLTETFKQRKEVNEALEKQKVLLGEIEDSLKSVASASPFTPDGGGTKQITTISSLNAELEKHREALNGINILDEKAILLQNEKIKKLEEQIQTLKDLRKASNMEIGPAVGGGKANILNPQADLYEGYAGVAELEGLQESIALVQGLEGAFNSMFSSVDRGLKGMAQAFAQSLKAMLAEMAAKAAIFALLNILSGGTGSIAKLATGIKGTSTLGGFIGIPNIGGGGSPKIGSSGVTKIEVIGSLKGGDIFLSNKRTSELIGSST